MTTPEVWELAGHYHGLLVYGVEGPQGESVEKLVGRQSCRQDQKADLFCKLWVGDTFPCPSEDWRIVKAHLIECEPVSYAVDTQRYTARGFRIGGYFVEPDGTDASHEVLFRGKFAVFSMTDGVESEVGYIKVSLI